MKTSLKFGKALFPGLLITLSACTSIPNDSGVGAVQGLVDAQIGTDNPASKLQPEIGFTQEQVAELLDSPLKADDAELLSMQLNPQARANLLQVGISEADYAQAGRLRNPVTAA